MNYMLFIVIYSFENTVNLKSAKIRWSTAESTEDTEQKSQLSVFSVPLRQVCSEAIETQRGREHYNL